jgi:2-polyprenyl-3-methyl-5-hydroxy-6-metoxy-1,4-benzoquinol methylase
VQNERIKYDACPLCESVFINSSMTVNCTGHRMWREPLEPVMTWMICERCGHVFTDGYFTDEALAILFGNTQDQQVVGSDIEAQRPISARMVETVVDEIGLPEDRLWLDVGFGNGSLLFTANEFGFNVFGIDARKQTVDDIERIGVPAHHGTIESAVTGSVFSVKPTVISLADVVEHEPFPAKVMRRSRELIADDGALLISMPNAAAPLWNYWNANDQNPYWHEIEHYHNFTRDRLYALLRATGFEPIRYTVSERYRCCMEIVATPT